MSKKKKIVIAAISVVALLGVCILAAVIYVNSGYRTYTGTFGYKLTFNTRKYEFVTSNESIDMYQIIDLNKADNDCYIYVGQYDPTQDLQETIQIVNREDGTNLQLMNTTVGSKDYPASFVAYTSEEGGIGYMYFVDYAGRNYVISTLADKSHESEIEEMLSSFTVIE